MIPAIPDQFSLRHLVHLRLILVLIFCMSLFNTPLGLAQSEADAEAEALLQEQVTAYKALDEAKKNEKLVELAVALTDRKAFDEAFALLNALGDVRVKTLYEAIENRAVILYEDKPVYFISDGVDAEGVSWLKLYPLLSPIQIIEEDRVPQAEMLARVNREDTKRFRLRTRNRRNVLKALQIIGLGLDDPEERRRSAIDLGNRLVVPGYKELVRVMENETDPMVRREAEVSVHLIRVMKPEEVEADEATRLVSIQRIGELKSIRGKLKLDDLLAEHLEAKQKIAESNALPEGHENKLSTEEIESYQAAIIPSPQMAVLEKSIEQIERHITFTDWVKRIFSSISLGSILILLALGLAITFGIMGVINMAHGEMLMVGAVATWACFEFLADIEWIGENYFIIAFPVAFLAAGFVGWLTEISIVKYLYKRPLDSMLATIGVSILLIQLVRLWKGDNLGMKGPSYLSGAVELMLDVPLPINRLFLIALSAFCVISVLIIMRFTRIGLLIRATVQNRDMAKSLGVNTRFVDMFTFSLGAGLAGLAGYGIVLITNPTPDMGQGFIVEAFLVTVVGGVGNLLGVVLSGLAIGSGLKLIEPIDFMDAGYTKAFIFFLVVVFITLKPQGLFPHKGRKTNTANESEMPWLAKPSKSFDWSMGIFLAALGLLVVPILHWQGYISAEFVTKLGWMATIALCAIGLDLIWGYMGALSLAQFMFFGLGAYAMALYLVNHGPQVVNTLADGTVISVPDSLDVVSSSVDGPLRPWFLDFFMDFHWALLFAMLIPGLLALIIGLATFRSRVTGVYFAILTQAVTVAMMTLMEKSDLLMGGTTGLYNYDTLLGQKISGKLGTQDGTLRSLVSNWHEVFQMTRFWWYIVSVLALLATIVLMKWLMSGGFGRVLIAIRDDESRLRFCGYKTWVYKTAAFTMAAVIAGLAGALYVPHRTTVTPSLLEPSESILIVVLVALGGRSTIWGPVIGAFVVLLLRDILSSSAPEWYVNACSFLDFSTYLATDLTQPGAEPAFYEFILPLIPDGSWLLLLWSADGWPLVLGALFVLVTLLLPGGLMSVPSVIMAKARSLGKKHNSSNIPDSMIDREVKA